MPESKAFIRDKEELKNVVDCVVRETKITDLHTHLYSPSFGKLLLWGIDELLIYHYLVAEFFRLHSIGYKKFWALSKTEQAELIWKTLFLENAPLSESARGVITVLNRLGIDTKNRNLKEIRKYFADLDIEEYVEKVFQLANVKEVVMTNDPFDDSEREIWLKGIKQDSRFKTALRLDKLLNKWPEASVCLKGWGHKAEVNFAGDTIKEVRRFLNDWIEKISPLYLAVSLPPDFAFPAKSARSKLIEECVLPVCQERKLPFALMVGVKKMVNPSLRLAGDGVGKANITAIEHLCRNYPQNKFLVTFLSRENQHELCVLARKFKNLMIFGCWWFLNNPSIIEEITRERFELLGLSFIPQHSDARVLDQLIYKWDHSRKIIADVLREKYTAITESGWQITEDEIRRDVSRLFSDNFYNFLSCKIK